MTRQRLSRLLVTVLSGGGALLDVAPESGTLYDAAADGTYTLTLTQPASPAPLTRIELRYRVTDADNYWTLYIERNAANDAWDLKWGSVASGTASFEVETDGIGTVQALRVTLDGADHEVFSSSDGESFTSRGTVTSATYQTKAKVGSSYTGAGDITFSDATPTEGDTFTHPADFYMAFDATRPSSINHQIYFRLVDINNYIWVRIDDSGLYSLRTRIAGVSDLLDTGIGFGASGSFFVTAVGSKIQLYIDGVLKINQTVPIFTDFTAGEIERIRNGTITNFEIRPFRANLDNETDGPSRLEQS
jgi:hypothetical protein